MDNKIRVSTILRRKSEGVKITALTAYDYTFGYLIDEAGVDLILVGDSCGNVCAGYETTLPVTVEELIYHTRSVKRGVKRALLVADMPFMSYQETVEQALHNAGRFMKEGGAEAVKVEGGEHIAGKMKKKPPGLNRMPWRFRMPAHFQLYWKKSRFYWQKKFRNP